MFGLFKSKTKKDAKKKQYEKRMSEWHKSSSIDRSKSDKKYAEAQKILDQIEVLKQN